MTLASGVRLLRVVQGACLFVAACCLVRSGAATCVRMCLVR
jgi:hypothetical protein